MAIPPNRAHDSEQASILFGVVLNQMALKTTEDALLLWQDVPVAGGVATARATETWLATAIRYAMGRRLRARDLALAYYRYQRALNTGTTIALPGQDNPPYLTLPELKREFEFYLNPDAASDGLSDTPTDTETQAVSEAVTGEPEQPETPSEPTDSGDDEADDENDRILVEEIADLEAELAEIERQAEQELRNALTELGPKNQERKIKKIDPNSTAQSASEEQKKAHKDAGNRQAASMARVVRNGARGPVHHIGSRDKRAIAYVRLSRTGTPCGWCAMLISRGPVYKGAQGSSALVTFGDLDLYHDNCNCYAVPIFTLAQYDSDALFALNREYAALWPKVTKGLGGKSAISAWRRFIRQQARSQKPQEAAA